MRNHTIYLKEFLTKSKNLYKRKLPWRLNLCISHSVIKVMLSYVIKGFAVLVPHVTSAAVHFVTTLTGNSHQLTEGATARTTWALAKLEPDFGGIFFCLVPSPPSRQSVSAVCDLFPTSCKQQHEQEEEDVDDDTELKRFEAELTFRLKIYFYFLSSSTYYVPNFEREKK